MSRVVIIGAGFGGLGAAHNLVGSGCENLDVTLVDGKDWFTIGGTWQYAWSGRVSKDATTWPLEDARAALKGIDMRLNTTVASLDLAAKTVVLTDGTSLPYDHLVLSPGVVGDASGIPGMSDALDMYSYDDVARQEAELADIIAKAKAGEKQALVIAIGATPYKCPVAPFEVGL
jgi:NADH dehydrogenase FAD-containing subunit